MPGRCEICEKGPSTGIKYVRRGLAKAKGGVGRKVTGKTGRWFRPNLQHLKVVEAERPGPSCVGVQQVYPQRAHHQGAQTETGRRLARRTQSLRPCQQVV